MELSVGECVVRRGHRREVDKAEADSSLKKIMLVRPRIRSSAKESGDPCLKLIDGAVEFACSVEVVVKCRCRFR